MARLAVPRALAPLRHRSFRLLTAGQVTSNVGDACYAVALPWYVLAGHGGAVLLGTVLAAYGIPRTALIAAGGYASDRWRPQTVMMTADIARTLGVAGLAAAAAVGPARAILLIPVAVVLGAGEGLFLPGSYSIIPSLVPGEDLQASNALSSSGTQVATLAGPVIGGVLVALGSPSIAFALDAASFAVSAATLAGLRGTTLVTANARHEQRAAEAPSHEETGEAAVADIPSLLTLFRTERILQIALLVNITANLGSAGMDYVALPSLAHGPLHSGADGYGFILAAFGGGALVGTVIAAQAKSSRRPLIVSSTAFLIEAAFIGAVPFLGSTIGVAAAMTGLGITNGFGNVITSTTLQRWAPPAMLGRLVGVLLLGSFGVYPLSVALAALFTRDLGPGSFFIFTAATLTAAILAGLTQREWRDFGVTKETHVSTENLENTEGQPA